MISAVIPTSGNSKRPRGYSADRVLAFPPVVHLNSLVYSRNVCILVREKTEIKARHSVLINYKAAVAPKSAPRSRPGMIALGVSSILSLLCHSTSRSASFAAREIMYDVARLSIKQMPFHKRTEDKSGL